MLGKRMVTRRVWFVMFSCYIAFEGKSVSASCPLTITPSRVVVKYGDSILVNCSSTSDQRHGIGWEASYKGTALQYVDFLEFRIEKVGTWSIVAECYMNFKNTSQCSKNLPIIVYKMPHSVSISPPNENRPMVEGREYQVVCDIVDVAPAENLLVTWYRDDKRVFNQTFHNLSTPAPLNLSSVFKMTAHREYDQVKLMCEARFDFGPTGPRLQPTRSASLKLQVHLSADDDRDLMFCGTWHHERSPLSLNVNLTTGCEQILISANESSLFVHGKITTQCSRLAIIPLKHINKTKTQSSFCLSWEPLLDQLKLMIEGEVLPLCWPSSLKDQCCTYLSNGPNQPEAKNFGIADIYVNKDLSSGKKRIAYEFNGSPMNCRKTFCEEPSQGHAPLAMVENTQNACAQSTVIKLEDDFGGYNVTFPAPRGIQSESIPTIYLPASLKQAAKLNKEVVCSYFRNNSLFQEGQTNGKVLVYVVAITVEEDEVIKDLAEPIRIGFSHDVIAKTHLRKCVSWDTKNDPLKVNWVVDGCETRNIGENQTECLCNHLTYFTVLVQLEPKPVRHLLALTVITSLGCAASLISCMFLIIHLSRKSRKLKEHSALIHMGLAVSLALLNLLFSSTGFLAEVGGESVCVWVGGGLHYALLSSLIWMGIEVFHSFWLVHMVFSSFPKLWIWNLIGFVLPAVPVVILSTMKDIYGLKKVNPNGGLSDSYQMCWMKNNHRALLAHYVINMTLLAILVLSGLVVLCLVYRKIRNRDEWRQNRVAFLSIWGLSCLYGTTWGLTFLDIGPLTDFILFLSCILNSFQGFLLMLRFYLLDWMQKRAAGSVLHSSSSTTGSTVQRSLQTQKKSYRDSLELDGLKH